MAARRARAFQSGDYLGSIKALDKVPDDAVDGMVAQTRKLAMSTVGVTESFVETKSPKGHFLIRYAPGHDAAIAELAGEVLDSAWQTLGDDLGLHADPVASRSSVRPPISRSCRRTEPRSNDRLDRLSKYNKLMVVSPRAALFATVDGHARARVHA